MDCFEACFYVLEQFKLQSKILYIISWHREVYICVYRQCSLYVGLWYRSSQTDKPISIWFSKFLNTFLSYVPLLSIQRFLWFLRTGSGVFNLSKLTLKILRLLIFSSIPSKDDTSNVCQYKCGNPSHLRPAAAKGKDTALSH